MLLTLYLHFGEQFLLKLRSQPWLENLTERVGGSNELVDRWLQVRKHLLVAYYNLVGLKPGKESFMRLNESAG
jgi:regulator of sigma D